MRVVVVTSDQHNWLLRYDPEGDLPQVEVLLAYESPVHYNGLRWGPATPPDWGRALGRERRVAGSIHCSACVVGQVSPG
jgi:hypothetical protein